MVAPMTVAVWLIDGAYDRRGGILSRSGLGATFAAGWWMGFGYFLLGLWWVGAAFLVEANKFAWALPLGVVALPAGLALFWGLGFVLARALWSGRFTRIFALAFGLGVLEWARGVVLTGFPWNDVGMALGGNLTLAQAGSLVGLHGLTFVSIVIFAMPATLWSFTKDRLDPYPLLFSLLLLGLIAVFGWTRLSSPPSPSVPGVKLRLIQPNVSQGADFSPENKDAILARYIDLSEQDVPGRPPPETTHFIWPESAFPFILSRDAAAMTEIAEFLGKGRILITGAARMEGTPGQNPRYYNSIQVLDNSGLISARYDKQHLVPFGEYIPLQSLLDWTGITQFVDVPGGFSSGAGRQVLNIPGLPPAIPLICYEAIFPSQAARGAGGAGSGSWLLNVTDDAWFGLTPGPYQHYAQARLRAIELGLPLVRDANSGISAVVDGLGRQLAKSSLGVEAVVDAKLPEPLSPTWQRRFGSLGATIIALTCLALSLTRTNR